MPEQRPEREPGLYLLDGTDALQLEDGGKTYHPGDKLPKLSHERVVALQSAGIRIMTLHPEPPAKAERKPGKAEADAEAAETEEAAAATSRRKE